MPFYHVFKQDCPGGCRCGYFKLAEVLLDTETACREVGFAYALQTSVVAFRTDFHRCTEIHDSGINLLLYYGSKKYVEKPTDPVGKVVEVVRGIY